MPAADWRDDEADEAAFDAGFEAFVKQRNIPLFKKGEWSQDVDNPSQSKNEPKN